MARLVQFIRDSSSFDGISCFWTDSMIVLARLKQHPSCWMTFVVNRVADVQARLPIATEDNPANAPSFALTVVECNTARSFWIKMIQSDLFSNEIVALAKGRTLLSRSSILLLRPFLDRDGVFQVGGRLRDAPLPLSTATSA